VTLRSPPCFGRYPLEVLELAATCRTSEPARSGSGDRPGAGTSGRFGVEFRSVPAKHWGASYGQVPEGSAPAASTLHRRANALPVRCPSCLRAAPEATAGQSDRPQQEPARSGRPLAELHPTPGALCVLQAGGALGFAGNQWPNDDSGSVCGNLVHDAREHTCIKTHHQYSVGAHGRRVVTQAFNRLATRI